MRALACLVVAALGAAVAWSEDGCPTCGGSKQVKCFQYGGKGGAEGSCAACRGAGHTRCSACSGSGARPCGPCDGTGRIRGFKCCLCDSGGALRCKLCDAGKLKCPACRGSGEAYVGCPACEKSGKLPCPECSPSNASCDTCQGAAITKCPICAGKGEMPGPCGTCDGRGRTPCAPCDAFGALPCAQCKALGAKIVVANGKETLQKNPCPTCNQAGEFPCNRCQRRGTSPCTDCAEKGTTGIPCWRCEGQKSVACLRCAVGCAWQGEDAQLGIRAIVLDCDTFQPQAARGLKAVLGVGDFVVWRIVLDARGSRKRFALGGPDGWELALVDAKGAETVMTDLYAGRSPEEIKVIERWTLSQGDAPEAYRRPFRVVAGDVGTCLAATPRSTASDAKLFRLRFPKDPGVPSIDLLPGEALWQTWVRERLLAAPE